MTIVKRSDKMENTQLTSICDNSNAEKVKDEEITSTCSAKSTL